MKFTFPVSIITFIFVHYASKFMDRYPNGWRQICCYAVGVLFTYPFYLWHLRNGETPDNAFLLAFLGSGIGTAFGWMGERVSEE